MRDNSIVNCDFQACAHVAWVNKMFVPFRECHNTDGKDLGYEYGALEDKSIGVCLKKQVVLHRNQTYFLANTTRLQVLETFNIHTVK